ncbi:hypothetical protein CerSpe_283000 [Prunus speciosa]
MEAQKRGKAKGKRKAESNVQQSRVSRDAFFNFMKKEQHEMGKVANAKLDSKVQEGIVNKWRKLNPKEKATYGSTFEGSSGQVNDLVNEMGFITRCSPDQFYRTVKKLSNEKRLTINAIGFGNVTSLSCTRLHRQLCQFLIQRFNPDTSSIELHGNVFGISAVDFGRVMGLKNTGEDVELGCPVEDENVKQLVKSFGGKGKRVLVRALAEQLEKCENADEDFKVRFVMFALGTVLCPTSSPSVTGNYLTFLTIPGKIESKNWADHGFNFLCEGVRSFKSKKVAYVNGSLLFLQLFYFDSIVHGGVYVDKSLDPIVSWDNNLAWKLMKWVIKQGGFDSPTVRVVSKHSTTNKVSEVSEVNLERIVQEVVISLVPVIQAEVKRSVEGLAITLGPIIQAEVHRSVLELIEKVMSEVSSFMKDARQHLLPGHVDANQTKEDGALKKPDESGENVVTKKGEECSKLNEKGAVDVNNLSTPLSDRQSFIEPELKIGVEKRKFTKSAHGDRSGIKTRRTAERRPGLHCRQHRTPEGANIRVGNISPQAWSVGIPSWGADNGSKLMRIPRGQDSADLPLPDGVTHVTAQAATEILELNAGLNVILFSTSLEASTEIKRLRQEIEILKKNKGTTIGSETLGQDVLDDDTLHKFRSKVKHDILRKGKTKIVVPQEHEKDEEEGEEEEEREEEEEEEDDEEEAWVEEDEDDNEAADKGNEDAESHSIEQKRKCDNSVYSCTPKRKKTD